MEYLGHALFGGIKVIFVGDMAAEYDLVELLFCSDTFHVLMHTRQIGSRNHSMKSCFCYRAAQQSSTDGSYRQIDCLP